MENLLVWILIFAGATIGLLATFLIASERQLQKAQDQEENSEQARATHLSAYATPRGEEIPSADTENELARELTKLQSELRSSQATITELQEWLIHSQRRQQDLSERGERLEAELDALRRQPNADGEDQQRQNEASQPGELDDRHKETAKLSLLSTQHEELARETARLRQQLANQAVTISELENSCQELAHTNRAVDDDNLRLRSQIVALRHQLDDSGKTRERWQQARILLSDIFAKQTAAAHSAQEIQQALLQLNDLVVADHLATRPGIAPEVKESFSFETHREAVELTETEVFFAPAPSEKPIDQPHRRANNTPTDRLSSALAITIFLVAIGGLASQAWRLNPAGENSLAERKSLAAGAASAASGKTKTLAHTTGTHSDESSQADSVSNK